MTPVVVKHLLALAAAIAVFAIAVLGIGSLLPTLKYQMILMAIAGLLSFLTSLTIKDRVYRFLPKTDK
jgi:type IV secretory pathway VirB2 component (pilin)